MLSVIATERAVPALPFMGLAMLLVHPETRLPPAEERPRAFIALALLLCLLGLFYVL
jgi:hypothetical protein